MDNLTQAKEAIVLAGGFGTRLQKVVNEVPKPMAPVCGRPFLSYVLDYLIRYKYTHVVLATGYLHEKIENYFEVSVLKPANEIFDSEITRKIFDKMVEKKYIYPKSQLTHEDFHLILNLKMPKKNHLKILKTTLFANIFR